MKLSRHTALFAVRHPHQPLTLNRHIQFFPYRWSLLVWTGTDRPHTCELVGDDWLYVEDVPA